MTSHDNSSTPFALPQEGSRLPAKIAEVFLSWRPTEPSSWVTPPGTETHPARTVAHLSDKITTSPRCSSIHRTICTSMQRTLPNSSPPPWTLRTPTATPQPTPSPAPHQSLSPTPTPALSPHCRTRQPSTLWDHYIGTQGFQIHDPLYHSPTPCSRVKKPKKYRVTLEEKFDQEQLAQMTRPTHGRMLTRVLLGKIMASHHPHPKALS